MRRGSVVVWLISLLAVAGCIPPRPTPTPPPSVPASPSTPSAVTSPSPDGTPSGTFPTAPPAAAVSVDPTLLDLLPDAVDGVPLQPDTATAAEIAGEPSIAPFVSSLAIASAFGPPASEAIGDYVVVTVARVKSGLFGDVFFQGWRDTFDEAVCQQAGGVQGNVEAEIGGRQTFIGTCAGGIHTYHVHLPGRGVIVSMQSGGPKRFGERVVEGLNE